MNRDRHPAHCLRRIASTIAVLSVMLVSAGCETTGSGLWPGGAGEGRAQRLVVSGDYAEAAAVYIGLASETSGTDRDRLTLLAVEQWLNAGDVGRARNAQGSVLRPATRELRVIWTANEAALNLASGNPDEALALLEPLSRQAITQDQRLRIEVLRADTWFQKDEPARAVELMIQRETWLNSSGEIRENRERLWQGLLVSKPVVLRNAASITTNPVIAGWLSLGSLATTTGQQGIGWSNGIVRWREKNVDHPAILVLGDLQLTDTELLDYPRRIALLLPLSGRTASAGRAIQNGFLGAYFATAGGLDDRQSIRLYDVNAEGGASAAYSAAVSDGAEFVVGPLLRSSAAALAQDDLLPVPVLTLNYLPDDIIAPPGLFQFALSPEDEAISAAERAIRDGHSRAVALVPNSNWGRRVLQSFVEQFEALGGTTLDYRMYTSGNPDYSGTIEDLMALSGSVRRYNRLRANIGGPLQFDPRRREDTDFIFLGADAANGRLLKSQLKFHYSGDLPVYSTSSINAMDGRSNSDLNGIRFTETPWVIQPQGWIDYLPGLYKQYWPQERRLTRLHAMGYDAYQLVAPLFANRDGRPLQMDGATGILRLDVDGRIHRELAWAEFSDGQANPLPPEEEDFGLPIPETEEPATWYEPLREL